VHLEGNEGPPLTVLLDQWRSELADWAIPRHILDSVSESPWVLPRQVFARRADRLTASPTGESYHRAWAALDPPGSVLDVGAGAGAACLPLLPRCTALTAVDVDDGMLELLGHRAAAGGLRARLVSGRWPEVAGEAGTADVVTCNNVTYNVWEIEPFLAALTRSARRQVVLEMTAAHPLTSMNALWLRFHGLQRPAEPTAGLLLRILYAMRIQASHQRWQRQSGADYASFDELTDNTRRRLCLPPERADEVATALLESGVDPEHPVDLGTASREVMTIWWEGTSPPG
jgi:SAM-dependent methyltransferase